MRTSAKCLLTHRLNIRCAAASLRRRGTRRRRAAADRPAAAGVAARVVPRHPTRAACDDGTDRGCPVGGRALPRPRETVHVLVNRIRRAAGPAILERTPSGYRLNVELDVDEVIETFDQVRELEATDPAGAAISLRAAIRPKHRVPVRGVRRRAVARRSRHGVRRAAPEGGGALGRPADPARYRARCHRRTQPGGRRATAARGALGAPDVGALSRRTPVRCAAGLRPRSAESAGRGSGSNPVPPCAACTGRSSTTTSHPRVRSPHPRRRHTGGNRSSVGPPNSTNSTGSSAAVTWSP